MYWSLGLGSELMMCVCRLSRFNLKIWNRLTGFVFMMSVLIVLILLRVVVVMMRCCSGLFDQFAEFVGLVFLVVSVGLRCFAFGDAGLVLGELGIELDHVLLVVGNVFFWNDGVDWALWDADGAVDALVWVDC